MNKITIWVNKVRNSGLVKHSKSWNIGWYAANVADAITLLESVKHDEVLMNNWEFQLSCETKPLEDFVAETVEGIKVFSTGMLDAFPQFDYSDEGIEQFKAFCQFNKISYYGKSRREFNIAEAVKKAKAEGAEYLIAEDLS